MEWFAPLVPYKERSTLNVLLLMLRRFCKTMYIVSSDCRLPDMSGCIVIHAGGQNSGVHGCKGISLSSSYCS